MRPPWDCSCSYVSLPLWQPWECFCSCASLRYGRHLATARIAYYIYIYIYIYAFIYLSLVHAYVCDCCSGARSTSSAGSTCGLPACTPLQEKHKQKQYINIATLHDCMSKDILNLATTNYDAEIAHQVHGSKTRKQSRCLCVQYCLVSAFVYMHGFSSRPCLWAALGTHSSTFGG
jgi:hypothetical protein